MLIAVVIKTKVNIFKSISMPNKCLLLAMEYSKGVLSISAVRAVSEHQPARGQRKSSSLTPMYHTTAQ